MTSTVEEETPMTIEATKQVSLKDTTTTLLDSSDLDFDNCTLFEVIRFFHKMSRDPHTSTLNLAFTEHITNALIKAREEKLRVEASIPRNLEDGWDPMIKIKLNNFSCYALCDVGASTSVMPKRMYDIFELKPFDACSFGVRLVDSSVKKPLGKIDDVLIIVNDNYVPVDFTIMDIECEPSCPIILGRPFLRIVGAIIDMKEGNIKSNSLSRKGWNISLGKILSYLLSPVHGLAILFRLIKFDLVALCLAQRRKRKRLLGGNQICFPSVFSGLYVSYYCSNIIVSLF